MKPQGEGRVRCSAWLARNVRLSCARLIVRSGMTQLAVWDVRSGSIYIPKMNLREVNRLLKNQLVAGRKRIGVRELALGNRKRPRRNPSVLALGSNPLKDQGVAVARIKRVHQPPGKARRRVLDHHGASKNVIFHKGKVRANDPSSATRPTRAFDCNLDAMAGFAAAHG